MLTKLRYLANALLLIGQGVLLYGDIQSGILVKLLGGVILITCLTKERMWDMIIVLSAFLLLDTSKLLTLWCSNLFAGTC